jgi:hypothetical protein
MKAAPSVFINKLLTAGCRSCGIWRRVVAELRTAVALSSRVFPLNSKLIYVFLDSDSAQILLPKYLCILCTGMCGIFVVFGASGCVIVAELEVINLSRETAY